MRPPQWKFSANIHSQPRIYQGRTVRPKCIRIWRMRVCRECRLRWTHEPCVPTGQVNFRLLPRRHNMTSLRSLYVPHGSLLLTTYYLLLTTYYLVSSPASRELRDRKFRYSMIYIYLCQINYRLEVPSILLPWRNGNQ